MICSKSSHDYVHLERYNLVLSTACGAVVKVCYSLSGQIGLASQNDNGNTSTRTAVRQSMQTMPATTEVSSTADTASVYAPCLEPAVRLCETACSKRSLLITCCLLTGRTPRCSRDDRPVNKTSRLQPKEVFWCHSVVVCFSSGFRNLKEQIIPCKTRSTVRTPIYQIMHSDALS